MKAFQVIAHDSAPQLVEVSEPRPGPAEVLLQIEACGVNFADTLMAQGRYQDTPEPPFTLGMEVCGTVLETGADVSSPRPGQRVIVFGGTGGMAERGVFPAAVCRPIPDDMPAPIAAGFQIAYGTSHLALTRRARLRAGERLIVLGAAGGVGLTAVEIGKMLGAEVIAVARGAEKQAVARAAGADHSLDATDPDLTTALKALGGGDVLYDAVGGDLWRAAFRAMRPEARLLTIGFASGDVPQIPANHLLVKNLDVIGFYWGAYLKFAPEALGDSLAELLDWYGQGRLKPHVSHCLPLDQADEALDLLISRRATGKVVITP